MAKKRWSRSAKATIALVICAVVLVLGGFLLRYIIPDSGPAGVRQAEAELTQHLDDVVATLPADLLQSDEQSASVSVCPIDDEAKLVGLRRVVTVSSPFDRRAWPAQLADRFSPDDGWRVSASTLATNDEFRVRLVGLDLSIVTAIVVATDDGSRITLTSSSPCTAG